VRYHSLIVEEPLPSTLRKIAWTADGIVMALRHASLPIWGVQFHPESICSEYGCAILSNFLSQAKTAQAGNSSTAARIPPAHSALPRGSGEIRRQVLAHKVRLRVSPSTLFRELFGQEKYAFWLDSAAGGRRDRFSFLGSVDESRGEILEYDCRDRRLHIRSRGTPSSVFRQSVDSSDGIDSTYDR